MRTTHQRTRSLIAIAAVAALLATLTTAMADPAGPRGRRGEGGGPGGRGGRGPGLVANDKVDTNITENEDGVTVLVTTEEADLVEKV